MNKKEDRHNRRILIPRRRGLWYSVYSNEWPSEMIAIAASQHVITHLQDKISTGQCRCFRHLSHVKRSDYLLACSNICGGISSKHQLTVCTSHWKPNWSGLFNHAYLLRNLEETEMQVFRHTFLM
jgi:hypothetical protein